ncbi:MAG TPA: helix-turn-helix domain-containing protein [Dermatophilaceae bacterium]|nr:helix-turn-helix domain-containing protein [Dermatophilaceae bacterium]
MTVVKGLSDEPAPLPALVGFVFGRVRVVLDEEDWGGLRQSHIRVLSSVPNEGVSVTALADRVRMTKQGAGQFVGWLADRGYLTVSPDPTDRRVRVVRRTPTGTRVLRRFARRMQDLETEWADQVGHARYAQFREVLVDLAQGESERQGFS